jgi:Ca2+-transporting ATPase
MTDRATDGPHGSGADGSARLPEPPAGAHARDPDEITEVLRSDAERGLDADEAERRLEHFGPNRMPTADRAGLLRLFLRQFGDPLVYVLLAAAVVSVAIGQIADAVFIASVLLLNAGLGTWQEFRAENAASALEAVMTIRARVLRDGDAERIDAEALVPGDVVELEAGDAVPADLRLIASDELEVDESMLTGESTPVRKDAEAAVDEDAALGDRATVAHAGCSVLCGRGRGIVVATGAHTQLGRIAESLAEDGEAPPMVVRMRRFTRTVAVAIAFVVAALCAVQFFRGAAPVELFVLAVALAVSAIPAGLPVAITVALSLAAGRMADRNVVVRRLPAVEGLGACTVIASDKTGTLTENRMTVRLLAHPDGERRVIVGGEGDRADGELEDAGDGRDEDGTAPAERDWVRAVLGTGAICNDAELERDGDRLSGAGNPVDIALRVAAIKGGLGEDGSPDGETVGTIPFDSERRYAAVFRRDGDRVVAHVKGAAETILPMCDADREAVTALEEQLAGEGYRVLALARGTVPENTAADGDPDALADLELLGLVGLIDPVRPEVAEAVEGCRRAGVDVCMVTGDHPGTALGIARELHIADREDQVLTGADLAEADAATVRRARVFARVEPLQKTEVVDALLQAGHFVTVTGDGVNDAPALEKAHIGVAMGKGGTDVARNAADLILTDDDFASIVHGVEEGRVAYDNIRKVVWLLVSTAVAELLLFALSVAFDVPMPLSAVQLLWLNLVTNGLQDVALAFEKREPGVLDRPPRSPDEPLFDRLMVEQVLVSGLYMGGVGFGVYWFLLEGLGYGTFEARNLLVLLLVLFENVHVFNVRSETRSAFRIPLANNPLLVLGVIAAQGIHVGSMFVPGWRDVLAIAPVSPATWGLLLAITLTKFAVVEAYKAVRGRRLAARR